MRRLHDGRTLKTSGSRETHSKAERSPTPATNKQETASTGRFSHPLDWAIPHAAIQRKASYIHGAHAPFNETYDDLRVQLAAERATPTVRKKDAREQSDSQTATTTGVRKSGAYASTTNT